MIYSLLHSLLFLHCVFIYLSIIYELIKPFINSFISLLCPPNISSFTHSFIHWCTYPSSSYCYSFIHPYIHSIIWYLIKIFSPIHSAETLSGTYFLSLYNLITHILARCFFMFAFTISLSFWTFNLRRQLWWAHRS